MNKQGIRKTISTIIGAPIPPKGYREVFVEESKTGRFDQKTIDLILIAILEWIEEYEQQHSEVPTSQNI